MPLVKWHQVAKKTWRGGLRGAPAGRGWAGLRKASCEALRWHMCPLPSPPPAPLCSPGSSRWVPCWLLGALGPLRPVLGTTSVPPASTGVPHLLQQTPGSRGIPCTSLACSSPKAVWSSLRVPSVLAVLTRGLETALPTAVGTPPDTQANKPGYRQKAEVVQRLEPGRNHTTDVRSLQADGGGQHRVVPWPGLPSPRAVELGGIVALDSNPSSKIKVPIGP